MVSPLWQSKKLTKFFLRIIRRQGIPLIGWINIIRFDKFPTVSPFIVNRWRKKSFRELRIGLSRKPQMDITRQFLRQFLYAAVCLSNVSFSIPYHLNCQLKPLGVGPFGQLHVFPFPKEAILFRFVNLIGCLCFARHRHRHDNRQAKYYKPCARDSIHRVLLQPTPPLTGGRYAVPFSGLFCHMLISISTSSTSTSSGASSFGYHQTFQCVGHGLWW